MINKTNGLILTVGPSITAKEVEYVTDAVLNGWNLHHSVYIRKFEARFAEYLGVKYALATSSCTGALHLTLLALGLVPGDEVIVPDVTWIATVSAVCYVGATPVFADIDPDTWVMDPQSVKKLLTPKTKAIIPVHLYGNPVDMEPLLEMATERGIAIVEDAAPSIGAEYHGKKTGSFGRAAVFSFQGAKALITGEGGMAVTNDHALMERIQLIGDHGRDPNRQFYNIEIGYKYKMSNLQAALGLAQIERVEEIVARKRHIYSWYYERLNDLSDIRLNLEREGTRNIY
jgi:perosamine synthetase